MNPELTNEVCACESNSAGEIPYATCRPEREGMGPLLVFSGVLVALYWIRKARRRWRESRPRT